MGKAERREISACVRDVFAIARATRPALSETPFRVTSIPAATLRALLRVLRRLEIDRCVPGQAAALRTELFRREIGEATDFDEIARIRARMHV